MRWIIRASIVAVLMLVCATLASYRDPYASYREVRYHPHRMQMRDRRGAPLSYHYHDQWNVQDQISWHAVPRLMRDAFVISEDKRFYDHAGVDWRARLHAVAQRISTGSSDRGASTLTEQVVKMLHPRERTLWAKWMEGIEAVMLEQSLSKSELMEFYLNQVPYAAQRRGVVQAARYYFNRDIDTLTPKEILALVVLVRAPSAYDLYHDAVSLEGAIDRLTDRMVANGAMSSDTAQSLPSYGYALQPPLPPVDARHMMAFLRKTHVPQNNSGAIYTTLDASMQQAAQEILAQRLASIAHRKVNHAAALVLDHHTREVRAWVSIGDGCEDQPQKQGCALDMVTTPRQAGSVLKSFLYAAALQKGWTPATLLEDAPYADEVGTGLHHVRNYSRVHYGKVPLRMALGNSLNIPAVRTIQFVTPKAYLALLRRLGFTTLTQPHDFYDDGLALGNGEITLLDLVQAYATFPQKGMFHPMRLLRDDPPSGSAQPIYTQEVASLMGHILSDPWARSWEFGASSVLNLPLQTAVKTGTSTDYRDAWAVGYNHRYVIGVWMGNADYRPMDGVTGSQGAALALRSLFHAMMQGEPSAPLGLSPRLVKREICADVQALLRGDAECATRTEYFVQGTQDASYQLVTPAIKPRIERPSQGLRLALDPRIPAEHQAFEMRLAGVEEDAAVTWVVDGVPHTAQGASWMWSLKRGTHSVQAQIAGGFTTPSHQFMVK